MPGFKIGKIGSRMVQTSIDEGEPSLLARAFRTRLMEESSADPALLYPQRPGKVRVAVYNDTSEKFRTLFRRIALTVIAPIIALLLIGFIVLSTINQPRPSLHIQTESVALGDVPVPAGVRPIERATLYSPRPFIDVYLNRILPNYSDQFKSAASYIGPMSQDELSAFYSSRLLQTKSLGWQTYGKPTTYNITFTSLYVRALSSQVPGSVEALVVQFEPVNTDILKQDPAYYDKQTKPGETVIILSKAWLTPRV